MQTKLTLRLNDAVITSAKEYANQNNTSLSHLVVAYFSLLTHKKKKKALKVDIPTESITAQLRGCLKNNDPINNHAIDNKAEYHRRLEAKYQ